MILRTILLQLTSCGQSKFFTESRLLQRPVRVVILSLPTSTATPFQTSANVNAPPPASIFIGTGWSFILLLSAFH